MLAAALLGRALAADPAATPPVEPVVLVRVDDREGRRLAAPWVSVMFPDGGTESVAALDDASDPEDAFAKDRLWLARLPAGGVGPARLLVTDGPPATATGAWIDQAIKVAAGGPTRLQLAVPDAMPVTGTAPTDDAARKGSASVFPVATAAKERVRPPNIGSWQAVHYTLATGLFVVVMVALHGVRQRVRRVEADLATLARPDAAPRPALRVPAWAWTAVSGLCLGVLAIAVWGPGLLQVRHSFLGVEHVDHYGTQWFYWFVEDALRKLENPAVSDRFFYPWGKDLYAHTGANILDAYVALPLRLLFGHVPGYNLFIVAGAAANAWAFWKLARDHTEDRVAVAVGSVLFALFPYILLEFQEGRPTQGIVVLPVLFVRHMLRTARHRGWVDPAIAGVLLAFTGYQYWFYAIFGGMICLAHGLWHGVAPLPGSGGGVRTFFRHGIIAGVALVLAVPVALPLAMASTSGEVAGLLDTDRWSLWSTPPVTIEGQHIAIFAWQPLRRYAGFFLQDSDDGEERFIEEKLTTPWVLVPLILVYFLRPHRFPRGTFLVTMLAAILVASGPALLVGDNALPNVPYIYMVKMIGVFKRLWWPQRMTLFIAIPAVLALVAVLSWLRRTEGPRAQAIAVALLSIAWAGDLAEATVLPFPTWSARVPAGYQCLAQSEGGAIIELPFAWTQAHVYYQTVHHHPMLGGMLEDNVSFTPPPFTEFRQRNTLVKSLFEAGDSETPSLSFTGEDYQEVRELGYRYVVVQKDAWYETNVNEDSSDVEALGALLGVLDQTFGAAVYDDARIAIYAPWGDPSPCDADTLQADRAAVGKLEVTPRAREPDIDKQLFTRW